MVPLIASLHHHLPQGELKNSCKLLFSGKQKEMNKLKHLLSHKATSVTDFQMIQCMRLKMVHNLTALIE